MKQRYMTSREAIETLGISAATLYSYVSRGLVRSEEASGSHRERRYLADDVERLRTRRDNRKEPSRVAGQALRWGEPVLESSISLIENGRLFYRGLDATALAESASVEAIASLIWKGSLDEPVELIGAPSMSREIHRAIRNAPASMTAVERFQLALPFVCAEDPSAFDTRTPQVIRAGTRITAMMTGVVADGDVGERGIAGTLANAWAPRRSKVAARALTAALILTADHELNVSAFTVRCIASAGSSPYDAIGGGLAALRGARHGGYTLRVESLLREIARPAGAAAVIASRLRTGEPIPGFGHELYPDGDPRAKALLETARALAPGSSAMKLIDEVVRVAFELTGERPTVDMGLAAVSRALGLAEGSPLTIFAIGRTIGWIGHAIEQYGLKSLIRPRARYTGVRGSQPAAD